MWILIMPLWNGVCSKLRMFKTQNRNSVQNSEKSSCSKLRKIKLFKTQNSQVVQIRETLSCSKLRLFKTQKFHPVQNSEISSCSKLRQSGLRHDILQLFLLKFRAAIHYCNIFVLSIYYCNYCKNCLKWSVI